jgi:3-polyprenyl-4-hydroxybenzoate decarboxylase
MGIDATKKTALENRRPTGIPVKPDLKDRERVRENWASYGLEHW